MGSSIRETTCELAIIGAGMTGMSAALFAAHKNLSVIQCGSSGCLDFSSGLLDLMGVYPFEENKKWQNPWEAIEYLKKDNPKHPYARISKKIIEKSFKDLITFFKKSGFIYHCKKGSNSQLPTAQGTVKTSYFVPQTMWNGVAALKEKKPCLLVDITGLREYSAFQVKDNLHCDWPDLRCVRIGFPGKENQGEVHPEHMARALENETNRKQLAALLQTHLDQESYLGLPAILGIKNSHSIHQALEAKLGVSIFEIPTPTVSVSGLRIKELFRDQLPEKGVNQLDNSRVIKSERLKNGSFKLHISQNSVTTIVTAKAILLASGRFFGKGLKAGRNQISEAIFNLPVFQPEGREHWHNIEFFNKKGHPINQAGLEVDDFFRPLDEKQKPVYENLFAAGSILAHQDWIREKSGSGIAVASAFSAVNSAADHLGKGTPI